MSILFLHVQSPTVNPYQHEQPSPPEEFEKIPISVKLSMYVAVCFEALLNKGRTKKNLIPSPDFVSF